MAARRRQTTNVRSLRRPTNWGGVVASGATGVPGLTKIFLVSIAPEFVSGETIRRIRGTMLVNANVSGTYHGAVGAYVANDNAVTAGVASMLDPVTNVGDDAWMFYRSFAGNGAGDGSAGAFGAQLLDIDSRAMRRVETGYQLVFVVANAHPTLQFNVALSLRATENPVIICVCLYGN